MLGLSGVLLVLLSSIFLSVWATSDDRIFSQCLLRVVCNARVALRLSRPARNK